MKVIPISTTTDRLVPYIWDPVDLYCGHLTKQGVSVICFIDGSDFCMSYIRQNPWIEDRCDFVVAVTEEVLESYQIAHVPSFAYFNGEYEIHRVIGAVDLSRFSDITSKQFGRGDL